MPTPNNSQKSAKVRAERTSFKSFLATNLNYFGNLPDSTLKPISKIIKDTTFEATHVCRLQSADGFPGSDNRGKTFTRLREETSSRQRQH